jgi:hypothetical protein
MEELDRINRAVCRSLRELNDIAVRVSSSSWANRKGALNEVAEALVHLNAMQRLIYTDHPNLEYHFDSERPATDAMKALERVLDEAEKHIKTGNVSLAVRSLEQALGMEPPPLTYESIQKRLKSLIS